MFARAPAVRARKKVLLGSDDQEQRHIAFCASRQEITVLPLRLPETNEYVERGILFSNAIAKCFGFDLVYIARLLQRHDSEHEHGQLVYGQLLGYHSLESVPQPLRIACNFHQLVIQRGRLEYSNPRPVGNGVFFAHALAFSTPCRTECNNTTEHSHFLLFAGYMFPRSAGIPGQALTKIRSEFYWSALSMVPSLVAAPWQYPVRERL